MKTGVMKMGFALSAAVLLSGLIPGLAKAGGGYFLSYGPYSQQMSGTTTAVGLDAFAGANNPAKLFDVGDRLDLGLTLFMPHRTIERTGASDPVYDFESRSKHNLFFLPDAGFARRINERFAWGVALYGNGGLNTDYRDTTGVPSSNFAPSQCGSQPANFLLGCGQLGFNLSQLIAAPTLAWQVKPGQTLGIAPLLALQRIRVYGLQAFEAVSSDPDHVTNQGGDSAYGAGVRIGWFGHITRWLDLGAAYSTRVYSQRFNKYRGLFADHGRMDIPENFSIGAAFKPVQKTVIAIDIQRINYHGVAALGDGVLNSLQDPQDNPLGSHTGSGLNWRNQTNYKIGFSYELLPTVTMRAGYAYGRRPDDASVNSISLNTLAPNAVHQYGAGASWSLSKAQELNLSYDRYVRSKLAGPSATAGFGVGGTESVTPYVDVVYLGWSWHI